MNITVKRKHSLFEKDFTHAHLVYIDSKETGEALKYSDVWSYKHNGVKLRLKPIFYGGSNYTALAEAIKIAINRYELAGLTGFENPKRETNEDEFIERSSNYRRPIIHKPTGKVFPSTREAAIFANRAESTIRTYVNPKYKGASYSAAANDWDYVK